MFRFAVPKFCLVVSCLFISAAALSAACVSSTSNPGCVHSSGKRRVTQINSPIHPQPHSSSGCRRICFALWDTQAIGTHVSAGFPTVGFIKIVPASTMAIRSHCNIPNGFCMTSMERRLLSTGAAGMDDTLNMRRISRTRASVNGGSAKPKEFVTRLQRDLHRRRQSRHEPDGRHEQLTPIDNNTGLPMTQQAWEKYFADFLTEVRQAFPSVEICHNAIWFAGNADPAHDPYLRSKSKPPITSISKGVLPIPVLLAMTASGPSRIYSGSPTRSIIWEQRSSRNNTISTGSSRLLPISSSAMGAICSRTIPSRRIAGRPSMT